MSRKKKKSAKKDYNSFKKRERREMRNNERKDNKKKSRLNIMLLVVLVVLLAILIFRDNGDSGVTSSVDVDGGSSTVDTSELKLGQTQKFSIQGQSHINFGSEREPSEYNSNPPTSGWHYAQAPGWGYYKGGLKDEQSIHSLEHGGISITYKNLNKDEVSILRDIQKDNRGGTLLSPREENDARISVASWGALMHLNELDEDAIQSFIDENKNKSPEPFAR